MKIQRATFCFLLLRNTAYAGCATPRLRPEGSIYPLPGSSGPGTE
jgi:hypothetical protein